jgi:tetratricopeptide (TPR) repeat protein
MRRIPWEIRIILLLVIVTTALYWPVLRAEFVAWDDNITIYQNPHLKGFSAENLTWMFTDVNYVMRYQPLAWLSWSLIYEFSGLRPFGYHLASLIGHCLNVVLVFVLLRKILLLAQTPTAANRKLLLICAALGAAIWALHPLRVEVVAWVSSFLHCQALFFLLLSALSYLEAHTPGQAAKNRSLWHWAAVWSFAASLLSYPIGLGFVVVLAVLDIFLLHRFPREQGRWWNAAARRVWLEKAVFAGAAVVVVGMNLMMRFHGTTYWPKPTSLTDFGVCERVLQACYIWSYYVWKPWIPFGLSPFYHRLIAFQRSDPVMLFSVVFVAGVTILLLARRARWSMLFAIWLCHLVLLVPVLGLTERPHFSSDRYSLVVSIIWALLLAAALFKVSQWSRHGFIALASAGAVAAFLAGLSAQQVLIWQNSVALFQHILKGVEGTSYCYDFYTRLGFACLAKHDAPHALYYFEKALASDPANALLQQSLGHVLFDLERIDDAIERYTEAARLKPDDANIRNDLGAALATRGHLNKAMEQFSTALRIDASSAQAHQNMARVLAQMGKPEEARSHLEKARPAAAPKAL